MPLARRMKRLPKKKPASKTMRAGRQSISARVKTIAPGPPIKADLNRAVSHVMKMMVIPGQSAHEGAVVRYIVDHLRQAGCPASAIGTDAANRKSRLGGETGNLIVKLAGRGSMRRAPRRMLMAHIDTVPVCVGTKPVRRGGWIVSADRNTGLGADDRAGSAVLLHAAELVLRHKPDHPPLTFTWCVQEEPGLIGSRQLSVARLGRPAVAFNCDGGTPNKLTIGATGAYRMVIDVHGLASHAGVAPQRGVSAITIASHAIARLDRGGWLGNITKDRKHGTSNVGYIHAGGATNVITNHAVLHAEMRSHDKVFRKRIVREFVNAFETAAKTVRSDDGRSGSVVIAYELDYEAFKLSRTSPAVVEAAAAVSATGDEPVYFVCDGGLDANWTNAKGIPTVTFGAGQHNPHMVSEKLNVKAFEFGCRESYDYRPARH